MYLPADRAHDGEGEVSELSAELAVAMVVWSVHLGRGEVLGGGYQCSKHILRSEQFRLMIYYISPFSKAFGEGLVALLSSVPDVLRQARRRGR